MNTEQYIAFESEHCAHNYHPLPVVISSAQDVWVTDVEGRRYLDMLSAYSALNFGHRHPVLLAALNHMSEQEVHDMCDSNDFFPQDEDEDEDEDADPLDNFSWVGSRHHYGVVTFFLTMPGFMLT